MPESPPVAEETGRRLFVELRQHSRLVHIFWLAFLEALVPALALLARLFVHESSIFLVGHVAKIARQVHYLMIAQHQVHATTAQQRLILESHHKIHDVTGPCSAIEEIAGEYEMGLAAAP